MVQEYQMTLSKH